MAVRDQIDQRITWSIRLLLLEQIIHLHSSSSNKLSIYYKILLPINKQYIFSEPSPVELSPVDLKGSITVKKSEVSRK